MARCAVSYREARSESRDSRHQKDRVRLETARFGPSTGVSVNLNWFEVDNWLERC